MTVCTMTIPALGCSKCHLGTLATPNNEAFARARADVGHQEASRLSDSPYSRHACGARKHLLLSAIKQVQQGTCTEPARSSNEGGTIIPSSFAVLRLLTSSYLVDAC